MYIPTLEIWLGTTLKLAFLISMPDVSDASGLGSHFEEYWCRPLGVANLYPTNTLLQLIISQLFTVLMALSS